MDHGLCLVFGRFGDAAVADDDPWESPRLREFNEAPFFFRSFGISIDLDGAIFSFWPLDYPPMQRTSIQVNRRTP
jgi:hypothetical protein